MKQTNNRLINSETYNPLKGKTLAVIDADESSVHRLQKTCRLFEAKLITANTEEALSDTVLAADHVFCYNQCPNPRLCEAAYENCAMFGKDVHILDDKTVQNFSHQLASLSVEVKTETLSS